MILYPLLYKEEDFFMMSKNHITKEEIKVQVEKLKTELYNEQTYDGKQLAHKYLNKVLDKIAEYRV
jgi:CRISPR/Cas system CSM-associated protein Csm2 small subunit